MVDNDEFTSSVGRDFRKASRAVYDLGDAERGAHLALREVARVLKREGLRGAREVAVVCKNVRRGDDVAQLEQTVSQLYAVARVQAGPWSDLIVKCAQSMMVDVFSRRRTLSGSGHGEIEVLLVKRVIAAFAETQVSPPGLLPRLVESEKLSFQEFEARSQRFREHLSASPDLNRLARQALADPTGARITQQRTSTPKQTQREMVHIAIG